ncbi:Transglycosylase SLT domain-containing protein [Roseovarius nanhaiticus]|uniref:Transglycosylase SLT domain-containing protein n=2 Tax=Roseovarius nanhaiticus TaxID=573024 RepID=A0A1N7HL00_9RHOB|nr:Transglycosylase SLT domain-containing protein [Roseovarius nanhaiticus]SIS25536.1 Transglycosylase SLT domain-containing protein [Roseovarius nanhaiticus]
MSGSVATALRRIVCALVVCLPASTSAATSEICDQAARAASSQTGVPLDVLLAITRSETGRAVEGRLTPWPWTVNMEGAGKWFASRAEALAYVSRHHGIGARSFDVGCFQVNYKWHGHHFSSIDEMFDPQSNALYAAEFLQALRRETIDWSAAAGAYHSRTPNHSDRYRARFDKIIASLDPRSSGQSNLAQAASDQSSAPVTRDNPYPFLKTATVASRFGSLVPLGGAAQSRRPLFAKKDTAQ